MCYSVESNFNNWLSALSGCILMLIQGKGNPESLWISIFTLTFTQIQILESILWAHVENKNFDRANKLAKYFVPLLWLQPLAQSLMGYLTTGDQLLLASSVTYLGLLIYDTKDAFSTDSFKVMVGEQGHLTWKRFRENKEIGILNNDTFGILYLVGLLFPLLFMRNKMMGISLLAFGILSASFIKHKYEKEAFNSMWCYVSIGYIFVGLFVNLIQKDQLVYMT